MDAIASAPSRIPMHNRLGELAMPLEASKVFFGPGSDCPFTIDVETGERRNATAEDVRRIARLCDGLEQMDFIMSMGTPSDVPPLDHYLHSFINMVRGSVKPNVYTANNRQDMEDIYRIACAVAGGETELREKPFLLHYAEPISPLLFNDESVDKLLFCAEKGIPVTYPPSPNTGGGGPITLAGALALGNAECLAGLVLTQLVRPGAPAVYGAFTSNVDMRSGSPAFGTPEYAKAAQASGQLARRYGLPFRSSCVTSSNVVDEQSTYESAMSLWAAITGGANIIVHAAGWLEGGLTASFEKLIVDAEMLQMMAEYLRPIEVTPQTLALDAIAEAGPGGHFFGVQHTMSRYQTAFYQPFLSDRRNFETWQEAGGEDTLARANRAWKAVLENYRQPALDPAIDEALEDYVARRKTGAAPP